MTSVIDISTRKEAGPRRDLSGVCGSIVATAMSSNFEFLVASQDENGKLRIAGRCGDRFKEYMAFAFLSEMPIERVSIVLEEVMKEITQPLCTESPIIIQGSYVNHQVEVICH